ncbi:hypothetical protein MBM_01112 [Drepanopeziza brunnea f. sp. 'multigermtubi' MB_m1]|uniref:Uncharacterized protein n=1 Tax=Marssonina brunnea f. sp. multigermtubi (strain MB_m1) TaxID=1072389 RepID=K1WS03_MARBU|nr:uncharacterized protein MBM_01112 [Drepanopeziza brunnea f. sp. 'multigermtubi' MB_m1]EKD20430.1 hypothetical protein MBM_01112 [Drepanopeziza brunnea f. sp. 'multigermtubi' MB_m1]
MTPSFETYDRRVLFREAGGVGAGTGAEMLHVSVQEHHGTEGGSTWIYLNDSRAISGQPSRLREQAVLNPDRGSKEGREGAKDTQVVNIIRNVMFHSVNHAPRTDGVRKAQTRLSNRESQDMADEATDFDQDNGRQKRRYEGQSEGKTAAEDGDLLVVGRRRSDRELALGDAALDEGNGRAVVDRPENNDEVGYRPTPEIAADGFRKLGRAAALEVDDIMLVWHLLVGVLDRVLLMVVYQNSLFVNRHDCRFGTCKLGVKVDGICREEEFER